MLHRVVWWKFTDVSEALAASITKAIIAFIAQIMAAISTSETSVNFYQPTRRNNAEDKRLSTEQKLTFPP
jgi:hypothetical protein